MYRKKYKTESSTEEINIFEGMKVSHLALEVKLILTRSCADPGIFVRGGPGQSDKKKVLTTFFFFFLSSAYFTEVKWSVSRKLSFFKVPEGVQHFPGGGPTFSRGGGSNCLFPIETHITCYFPGGGGGPDPLSPPPSVSPSQF